MPVTNGSGGVLTIIFPVVVLVVLLGIGLLIGWYKRRPILGLVLGLVLGPIGWIIIAVIPARPNPPTARRGEPHER